MTDSKQTEAARLANQLDYHREYDLGVTHTGIDEQAAAELRRQQAEIERLNEALALVNEVDQEQPAQRTWVGLTRAERFEIEKAMSKYYDYQHECKTVCLPEFARAIEAKLKEKNT